MPEGTPSESTAGATGDVTRLLTALNAGGGLAAEELLPLVYVELRRLAAWKMAREPVAQTLQPTALVHEAWLRLVADEQKNWRNRSYFFAAAAEAMRRILVEHARRRRQLKRGGEWARVELDGLELAGTSPDDRLLLVDEALNELARTAPAEAEVVKLHFFVGLEHAETAKLLGISERTVKRYWAFARVWLYDFIRQRQ